MQIQKREAEEIIEVLGIMPILQKIGKARLVGSVALDVIVKRDIDIHIVVEDLYLAIDKIYRQLLNCEQVKEVKIKNFGLELGVLVGIDRFSTTQGVWSIDFWVTTNEQTTGFANADRLLLDMTQEHKDIIIKIKNDYCDKYGGTSGGISPKIYEAVVYNNVKNTEEFRSYIQAKD